MTARRFVDRLAFLARVHAAQRDALSGEARRAAAAADGRRREQEAVEADIARVQDEVRASRRGAVLSLDTEMRLQAYLAREHGRAASARREAEAARSAAERAREALEAKLGEIRALDRHRARRQARFDETAARRDAGAADDAWLRRGGGGES